MSPPPPRTGASQGEGRGSQGDAFEIDSDESGSDGDAASLSPESSPLKKRANDNDLDADSDLELADVSAENGRNSKRGRGEGTGRRLSSRGSGGEGGRGGKDGKGGRGSNGMTGGRGEKGGKGGSGTGKRGLVSPSLEAFERLFSGQDFSVGSPLGPRKQDLPGNAAPGGGKKPDTGGETGDTFEIALTRVVRAPRRSSSSSTPLRQKEKEVALRIQTLPSSSGSSASDDHGSSDGTN